MSAMNLYRLLMLAITGVPVCIGVLLNLFGPALQNLFGANLGPEVLSDPVLTSNLRFLATMLFGYAPLTWYFLTDVHRHVVPLNIIKAVLFAAGMARLVTVWQYGWPDSNVGLAFVASTIGVELVYPPVLWLVLRRAQQD